MFLPPGERNNTGERGDDWGGEDGEKGLPLDACVPSEIVRVLLFLVVSFRLKDTKQDRKHTPAEGKQTLRTTTV